MALVKLVSVPLQKSSATPGTGVSLCHFPSLILSAVCLLVHLFVFKKCFPASGCGESQISANYQTHWDREELQKQGFFSFFPSNKQKV